ncbi:hypothetical protein P2Q00_06115 [Streptomyces coacervatus]|nr:hypothetical protein [Streptomyces coacervatus]MDF2265019.1 hypothetical protein [Streptomyces coacervatus]
MGNDAAARVGRTGRRPDGVVDVLVAVAPDPELDAEAGERTARQLRADIAELDIESVRVVAAGPAPDGAKGADAVAVGAIVVALSASGGVFTALVEAYVRRHTGG